MNKLLVKISVFALLSLPLFSIALPAKKTGEFYQITVYHFASADQQTVIEQYLKDAYLPALHKQQIKNIGVFIPIANDTSADKRLYVIVPIKSLQQVLDIKANLASDNDYKTAGKAYLDAEYKAAPYSRLENILLQAFPLAPFLTLPKLSGTVSDKVYELRSYESATEKLALNKIKMFNEGGEIDLFKKINANAVFYASVVAGAHMPNLMYMTSYENMADRDAHWKSFGSAPEWKALSSSPEYQNNVSHIDVTFMHATTYSDY